MPMSSCSEACSRHLQTGAGEGHAARVRDAARGVNDGGGCNSTCAPAHLGGERAKRGEGVQVRGARVAHSSRAGRSLTHRCALECGPTRRHCTRQTRTRGWCVAS